MASTVRLTGQLLLFIGLAGGLSGFAASAVADVRVRVSEEATARTIGKDVVTKLQPGVAYSLDFSEPVEINSSSRVPMILVPLLGKDVEITIDSPPLKEVVGKIEEDRVSHLLSSIMSELADIQNLIQKKRLNQAMDQLQALETRYPDVKFLEFTRASIVLLMGNRDEARRIAEVAAKAAPDYLEGKRFLASIKEGKP